MIQPLDNRWYQFSTVAFQEGKEYVIMMSDGSVELGTLSHIVNNEDTVYPVLFGEKNGSLA
jgi:hypothetical protein